MTDDIVVRLRDNAENGWIDRDNARKAADEIERLRAHLEAEQGVIAQYRAAMAELTADREALRALLREALAKEGGE